MLVILGQNAYSKGVMQAENLQIITKGKLLIEMNDSYINNNQFNTKKYA